MSWVHRVSHPFAPPPLRQVQEAARDLTEHVAPGKSRVVFETVTHVAIIGSALIGGALGLVHLYRLLFPRHKPEQHAPQPAAHSGGPPRRRIPHAVMASAGGHDGYEERGHHSR
jgi:hypothetical protein